jgi:hypothetical protein
MIPRVVDGGVTVRKYDSAIIGLGQTGPRRNRTLTVRVDDFVELTMATAEGAPGIGLVAISRAVVSAAAEIVAGVERAMVGEANVRTAQGNAWAAICADRARAQARADMDRLVAALNENGPGQSPVGSSPRSIASHTDLVSTGFGG